MKYLYVQDYCQNFGECWAIYQINDLHYKCIIDPLNIWAPELSISILKTCQTFKILTEKEYKELILQIL